MSGRSRRARVRDIHDFAVAMPHVTVTGDAPKVAYQVGGKSFVFFRTPRPDAVDRDSGEKLTDVVVIWVPDDGDKQALVQDEDSPFFTTPHFDGHPSVLIREADVPRLSAAELAEVIEDAWLSRASRRRAAQWLAEHRTS